MSTAHRLLAVLNDAKENRLIVSITEQADGQILATVDDGYYKEQFLADSLEYLVYRLEKEVDDKRLI